MKNLIGKFILLACLGIFSSNVQAGGGNNKTMQFKGKVVDNQGNPIAGAKVQLKENNKTIYTDFDGEFIVETAASQSKEIEISFVSFETQTIELKSEDISNTAIVLQLYSK